VGSSGATAPKGTLTTEDDDDEVPAKEHEEDAKNAIFSVSHVRTR
jgi:hypothetical protein